MFSIAGLRAYQGVYAHTQGLTCERTMWLSGRYHPGQAPDNVLEQPIPPGTAQNADHFAISSPFSAFFIEVVCVLGATLPRTAAAPPPIWGNCAMQGCDTPATRRKKASHGAKPPPATGLEGAGGSGGPKGLAAVPGPGRSTRKRQQHPAQANFACNSPTTWIDAHSKTAEYQRSDFNT